MLKKIMKAALAASLVFGMSSFAYAADFSVGGKFREYFGQYNSGAEDYSAHFANMGEANVKFMGKSGKLSVYHEEEHATSKGTSTDNKNSQTRLTYMLGFGALTIGNQTNVPLTIPFSGSGWTTSNVPNSTDYTLGVAMYSEDEGIGLTIPLEGMGSIQFIMYERGYSDEGTNMQLGASLKFGTVALRLGYGTAKNDDPADPDDKGTEVNAQAVRAKVGLGDAMAVTFDYAMQSSTTASVETKTSAMAVGLGLNGIGPGKLTLRANSKEIKDGNKYAGMAATFGAPIAKGASVELGYISGTTTPQSGSATTETFLGGGFTASF